jgi:hypothetical protein
MSDKPIITEEMRKNYEEATRKAMGLIIETMYDNNIPRVSGINAMWSLIAMYFKHKCGMSFQEYKSVVDKVVEEYKSLWDQDNE